MQGGLRLRRCVSVSTGNDMLCSRHPPPLSAPHFAPKYLDDIDQHKYLCGYISLYSNFLTILIFPVLILRILIFWNILIILKFPANGNGSLSSSGAGNNNNREVRKYNFISGGKFQHSENIFNILGGISTLKQYI